MKRSVRFSVVLCLLASMVACGDQPLNPGNELPTGFVDTPKAGEVLRPGPTLVGGWAVDDSAVVAIRIYFDRHFATQTTLIVPRPDVSRALPQYARRGDVHGWNVQVDFAPTPGTHTILVQAVDDAGATKEIGVIEVTAPQ